MVQKTYMVHMFEKRTRTNVQISLTPFRLERFEIDLWIRNWLFTKKNFSNHKILKKIAKIRPKFNQNIIIFVSDSKADINYSHGILEYIWSTAPTVLTLSQTINKSHLNDISGPVYSVDSILIPPIKSRLRLTFYPHPHQESFTLAGSKTLQTGVNSLPQRKLTLKG